MKSPEGHGILHELVRRADVLVQNLGPGAADRLGLGAGAVRAQLRQAEGTNEIQKNIIARQLVERGGLSY
jgi:alkylation response protein AidB-like acyl-CoA dehydrogenase